MLNNISHERRPFLRSQQVFRTLCVLALAAGGGSTVTDLNGPIPPPDTTTSVSQLARWSSEGFHAERTGRRETGGVKCPLGDRVGVCDHEEESLAVFDISEFVAEVGASAAIL